MINIQTLAIDNPLQTVKTKVIAFTLLTIITAYMPTVIHYQLITGPLINMALILAVFLVGPFEAVFLGLMPSVLALISGLLPLPLAPIVPFIMISNAIMVGIYYYLGKKHFGISIVVASFAKFLFLYSIAQLLINFLLAGDKFISIAAKMFGLAQFVTAVIGGLMAYAVLFFIAKSRL
jgi:hypothetical protein